MSRRITLVVVPIMLTALAACGGPAEKAGVATAASGPPAASAAAPAGQPDSEKFKACLGQNGVDVEAMEKGNTAAPELTGAVEKCRQFLPDSEALAAPMAPEEFTKVQAYAKCMRANGVPGFPDPNPAGNPAADWDGSEVLTSATGKKATETCGKELMGTAK